ncbi:putative teichuronic acid biosynthesis glycosyltransferase TuaG [Mycolicibacterium pulveris]|uniref:Putative teichuronic acid biosynthesis glycosyltransferase TuaG n=1 Tax=Mycolicibacterium pulveris TaxID=36813 RepID=A0A7I7UHD6_MYCPV|nr:glycosyltransferase family 2 protein [Mycolicibacterium pulveris]BBY80089.1 putative teichuronic acid biosynthesis glycosyltransferase TuaG [Mycolicibacterium pulveris]
MSVITPTFNCRNYVEEAIASVQSQTYDNWELVIVDDCSEDHTFELVQRVAQNEPRIRLFRHEIRKGAGPARTRALEEAKGRFIAYLDADDIWYPRKLEVQVNFMIENCCGFSCTSYEVISDSGKRMNKSVHMLPRAGYLDYLTNNLLQTVGIMIDTDVVPKDLLRMPPLERRQDVATWLQILKAGHINYGLPEVLAQYRRSKNSLSSNKFKAVRGIWTLYRDVEELPLLFSYYCFARYAVLAVWKRLYLNRMRRLDSPASSTIPSVSAAASEYHLRRLSDDPQVPHQRP